MYCPECGTRIDDDAVFCPECGTRVAEESAANAGVAESPEAAAAPSVYALMLTHVAALADKLGATPTAVRVALESFIAGRRAQGIAYTLIDGDSYDTGFGTRSLRRGAAWTEWADLLRDIHRASESGRMPRAGYLFIVGGDDIVPMPVIRHYLADDEDTTDTTIDTDVPYSYPYGGQTTQRAVTTGEIYDYEPQYMVGRLPLPKDARLSYLTGYLERAAVLPYVKVRHAYSQCDPHWRKVTHANVRMLRENGLLRMNTAETTGETFYSGIYLTPEVEAATVDRYLTPETQLAFFNLHGSAAPGTPGFMGQSVEDPGDWRTAVLPAHLQQLARPNIVVTEACYGARFKGFDTQHSMVQAALSGQTLLYVGSSRIAYGSVDSSFEQGETVKGSLADVLTSEFVTALMEGFTAGDALGKARITLLDNYETGPYEAVTLAEFNLYGDPTLQMAIAARGKAASAADPMPQPKRKKAPKRIILTKAASPLATEKLRTDGLNDSVLQAVRSAVDNQLRQIQESVAAELYEFWGIRPRYLIGASRLQYTSGRKMIALHYEVDEEPARAKAAANGMLTRVSVIASPQGTDRSIRAVYTTR